MQACIQDCLNCYTACYGMAMTHCLESGGEHVGPAHFRLMMACAEICATAARFMMMNSPHHGHVCRECAEICRACAADCEKLDGMQACHACAASCEKMASAPMH